MDYKVELEKVDYISLIKNRFGNIKRARGYYLYTDRGIRLLDMYLYGGRAILGHKPKGILTQYRRELDKGLFGILPYKTTGRLKRALKCMFPEYESAYYSTKEKAIERIKIYKDKYFLSPSQIPIYKYFVEQKLPDVFFFLPYPLLDATIVLYKNCDRFIFDNEDVILPHVEVTIARFIYELIAKERREKEGAILHSMKSKKALKKEMYAKKELESILPKLEKLFTVEGRYLLFKNTNEVLYKEIFLIALEHLIFLSPFPKEPSIFPEIENYNQIKKFLISI